MGCASRDVTILVESVRNSNLVLTWKVIFVDQTLGDELKLTKLTALLIHSGETSFPMVKIVISAAQSHSLAISSYL